MEEHRPQKLSAQVRACPELGEGWAHPMRCPELEAGSIRSHPPRRQGRRRRFDTEPMYWAKRSKTLSAPLVLYRELLYLELGPVAAQRTISGRGTGQAGDTAAGAGVTPMPAGAVQCRYLWCPSVITEG